MALTDTIAHVPTSLLPAASPDTLRARMQRRAAMRGLRMQTVTAPYSPPVNDATSLLAAATAAARGIERRAAGDRGGAT